MNPAGLLRADTSERATLMHVLQQAGKYRLELDKRLAHLIVAELSVWLSKGRAR